MLGVRQRELPSQNCESIENKLRTNCNITKTFCDYIATKNLHCIGTYVVRMLQFTRIFTYANTNSVRFQLKIVANSRIFSQLYPTTIT